MRALEGRGESLARGLAERRRRAAPASTPSGSRTGSGDGLVAVELLLDEAEFAELRAKVGEQVTGRCK